MFIGFIAVFSVVADASRFTTLPSTKKSFEEILAEFAHEKETLVPVSPEWRLRTSIYSMVRHSVQAENLTRGIIRNLEGLESHESNVADKLTEFHAALGTVNILDDLNSMLVQFSKERLSFDSLTEMFNEFQAQEKIFQMETLLFFEDIHVAIELAQENPVDSELGELLTHITLLLKTMSVNQKEAHTLLNSASREVRLFDPNALQLKRAVSLAELKNHIKFVRNRVKLQIEARQKQHAVFALKREVALSMLCVIKLVRELGKMLFPYIDTFLKGVELPLTKTEDLIVQGLPLTLDSLTLLINPVDAETLAELEKLRKLRIRKGKRVFD